jgi:hypothetical protein
MQNNTDNSLIKDAVKHLKQARTLLQEAGLTPNIDVWFHTHDNKRVDINDALEITQEFKEATGGHRTATDAFISLESRYYGLRFLVTHEGKKEEEE